MKQFAKYFLSALFALAFSLNGIAQQQEPEPYLKTEDIPDAVKFLPGPPEPGTAAFALDSAIYYQSKALREGERGQQAIREATTSISRMAAMFSEAFGMELSRERTPKILYLLDRSVQTFRRGVAMPKNTYMRKRPYVYFDEPTLIPMAERQSRNSGSFPSGHTVRGWGMALVLAQLNPACQDAVLPCSGIVVDVVFVADADALGRLDVAERYRIVHHAPALFHVFLEECCCFYG